MGKAKYIFSLIIRKNLRKHLKKFKIQLNKVALMKTNRQFTAIIEREGEGYVSLCPELDIASQGDTVEQARNNLTEALELFFEHASESEIKERLHGEIFITRLEVAVG
jgi:predicted RNase H-like HicB family nuclease